MATAPTPRPWFREPMVWLLIALPCASIVMGGIYAAIAFSVFDGVVVDDYYQRGKTINRVLARDEAAERRGLSALATLDAASHQVVVELAAVDPAALPATVKLSLLHATLAGHDQVLAVQRTADGSYHAAFASLQAGKYHLQLEADDWRIVGTLRAPRETVCALSPARFVEPTTAG